MHNEREQEVHEGHFIQFSEKKKSAFRQMGYYGPNLETKMTDSSNLQDYFLNFAQWKWKTDKWRLFCWNFQKDSHLGANGPTWA